MTQEHLKELLQKLHDELSKTESLDDDAKSLLGTVVDDIQAIAGSDDSAEEPHGLIDRLNEAKQDFEEDHPELTQSIGRVIDALARLGI
ncbi:MAG: DUF4404 family protein [Candidatus Hydrogenedentota bacterium]